MPNLSSNALILTPLNDQGIKDIADYIEEVKATGQGEGNGLFATRFPYPEGIWSQDNGWAGVEWCSANWGTKWDTWYKEGGDGIQLVDESDTHFHITFDTAWAPPTMYVLRLSEQLPNVKFELAYSEMGMGFAGVTIIQNGEVLSETEIKVAFDKDWDDCDDDEGEEPQPMGEWSAHLEKYQIHQGG